MAVQIIECEQGSQEWHRVRMKMPTSSKFATVMSSASGKPGTMPGRLRYLRNLATEILTDEPNMDDFKSAAMARGNLHEPLLRAEYKFITDKDPKVVGFVVNDGLIKGRKIGCSPDALLGDDGVLEIKSMEPALLIELLEKPAFPTEHRAQCQGSMWVTERGHLDLVVGWPGMPQYRATIKRDPLYCEQIKAALESFFDDLDKLVEWLRRYK